MRFMKSTICAVVAVILLASILVVPASAEDVSSTNVPYTTYMYDYNGNPIVTPHAYVPSTVFTADEAGIGAFTNPSDFETDSEGNLYIADTDYVVGSQTVATTTAAESSKDYLSLFPAALTEDTFLSISNMIADTTQRTWFKNAYESTLTTDPNDPLIATYPLLGQGSVLYIAKSTLTDAEKRDFAEKVLYASGVTESMIQQEYVTIGYSGVVDINGTYDYTIGQTAEYAGRLVVLNKDYTLKFVIENFDNHGKKDGFQRLQGVTVAKDGTIYVADTDNMRIVRFTADGQFMQEYDDPHITLLSSDYTYHPTKLSVDSSGNMYVVAKSVNMGLILLDHTGAFSGFVGAQSVAYSVVDYVWKMLLSQEQNDRMASFIPTEYNNITIDSSGFLYVTSSAVDAANIAANIKSRSTDSRYSPIKRLNPTGNDVLKRNGYYPPVGDVSFKYDSQGDPTTSLLADVALGPDGFYTVLDSRKNTLFTYSSEGELLYAFSEQGAQAGNSQTPVSILYRGSNILLLDQKTGAITEFAITQYGQDIHEAYRYYNNYDYDNSVILWNKVLTENANFDIAYDGLAKAQMREENYKGAMKNFLYSNNMRSYSKALSGYRTQLVENYLLIYVAIFVVIIWLLVRLFKWIGKRNRDDKYKGKQGGVLNRLLYSFHIMVHPFDGFWDMKHEGRGSTLGASIIVVMLIIARILQKLFTHQLFNPDYGKGVSILYEAAIVIVPFLLWVVANWGVTSLASGEGNIKDIYTFTGYSLMPMVLMTLLYIPASHIFILDEQMYLTFFLTIGYVWSGFLLFDANTTVHRYTVFKSIGCILLTILGMGIIIFVILIIFTTYQRIYNFIDNIITEVTYRI